MGTFVSEFSLSAFTFVALVTASIEFEMHNPKTKRNKKQNDVFKRIINTLIIKIL